MGRKSRAKKLRPPKLVLAGYPEKMGPAGSDRLAGHANEPYSVLAACALLLLAVFVVFGQTAANREFINFDDDQYIYNNQHVMAGLTSEGAAWAFTAFYASNWHPLTWLSHMLDCQLYGLKPAGHHLTNVLLHAAAAILLFLSLRRMTGALWPSAWVAAVFAIHPLRVESVAWAAERKDVLSGLFFMLALWCYARYAERPSSWGRYLSVMAAFTLGLLAKPMLVTLPFVLLLLDYWPLRRFGRLNVQGGQHDVRRLVIEKIPLFILAAASCAITLVAQRGAIQSLEQLPFPERLANAAAAYLAYIGKMLYPADLAVIYPLPKCPLPIEEVVAAVVVLLTVSTTVFVVRRQCPYLLVGWFWYLGSLVPVIGLVQVGFQSMADRYTYLTQIGLYVAVAWGAAHLAGASTSRRWGLAAVAALVLAGLMQSARQQTQYWRDSESLWAHTLTCTSDNSIAHYNFGVLLSGRGRIDDAMDQYREALEIRPNYADAHNNLGIALAGLGQVDEAIGHYRKAVESNPKHVEARNNLGLALAGRGQVDEAIVHYRKALEINPDSPESHCNLGMALAGRKQFDEAIRHYRRALEISPDYAEAHNNLGEALAGRNQFDEAIAHYRKALESKPDYAAAHNNLGLALGSRGQIDEAIAHFRRALEIKTDSIEAHFNLGLALAACKRVDEALEHYQKALELASSRNDKAQVEAIRERIKGLRK
jgi:protein O-mannosyl-transferase